MRSMLPDQLTDTVKRALQKCAIDCAESGQELPIRATGKTYQAELLSITVDNFLVEAYEKRKARIQRTKTNANHPSHL